MLEQMNAACIARRLRMDRDRRHATLAALTAAAVIVFIGYIVFGHGGYSPGGHIP